jgi:hypothetical protein
MTGYHGDVLHLRRNHLRIWTENAISQFSNKKKFSFVVHNLAETDNKLTSQEKALDAVPL